MMEDWVVFAFVGTTMLVIIVVARVLAHLDVRELPDTSVDLGAFESVEGLEIVANRGVYEAHLVEFQKFLDPFDIQVEFCEGRKKHFTRVTIDFPLRLHLGTRLQVDHEAGLANRLLQTREIEIGDEAFDGAFLIFGNDPEKVARALEPELRETLLELGSDAGDVRLSDETLLVVYPSLLDARKIEEVIGMMHRVAKSYTERGKAMYEASREGDEADGMRSGEEPVRKVEI